VVESFTAQIDPGHPNPDGTWPIQSNDALTIRTGDHLTLVATGSYNAAQGTDSETFQVVGGSGALAPTIGSGTVQTITTDQSGGTVFSTSTYQGALANFVPWKYYFPLAGGG
jgi:hypothetical protein